MNQRVEFTKPDRILTHPDNQHIQLPNSFISFKASRLIKSSGTRDIWPRVHKAIRTQGHNTAVRLGAPQGRNTAIRLGAPQGRNPAASLRGPQCHSTAVSLGVPQRRGTALSLGAPQRRNTAVSQGTRAEQRPKVIMAFVSSAQKCKRMESICITSQVKARGVKFVQRCKCRLCKYLHFSIKRTKPTVKHNGSF